MELYNKTRRMDKKLLLLFGWLMASFILCVLLFPKVLFRSSKALDKAYWRIACIGQQTEHQKHTSGRDRQAGVVSFMFDDGWMSQFTEARPIMDAYGYRGSIAVISDCVGQYDYMGLRELSFLYRAGWDMANHTKTHPWLSQLKKEDQRQELQKCRDWLQQYNMTGAESVSIFPGGYYNSDTFAVMREEGFAVARSVEHHWSLGPDCRRNDMIVISVTPALARQDIEDMLEHTAMEKGAIILIFHKLSDMPDDWGMSYPPDDFRDICKMVAEKQLQVLTISELEASLIEQPRLAAAAQK